MSRREAHLPKANVCVAYVHPGGCSASFTMSLLRMFIYEIGRTGLVPNVIALRCESDGDGLVDVRNANTRYFLDETTADWLFLVDTDMGFGADTIERLLKSAHKKDRPVVGALCFGHKREEQDIITQAERYRTRPVLYRFVEAEDNAGFSPIIDYERDALVQVDGTGAACLLVHRSVFERQRAEFGDSWWDKLSHPKARKFGEDLSFCLRCAALDIPVFVDTSVKTSHDKGGIFLTEEAWDNQQALVSS